MGGGGGIKTNFGKQKAKWIVILHVDLRTPGWPAVIPQVYGSPRYNEIFLAQMAMTSDSGSFLPRVE
jgi:hypothetical protein